MGLIACPMCKWIGFDKDLSSIKMRQSFGNSKEYTLVDVGCCPKCRNIASLLTPEYMGVLNFWWIYLTIRPTKRVPDAGDSGENN